MSMEEGLSPDQLQVEDEIDRTLTQIGRNHHVSRNRFPVAKVAMKPRGGIAEELISFVDVPAVLGKVGVAVQKPHVDGIMHMRVVRMLMARKQEENLRVSVGGILEIVGQVMNDINIPALMIRSEVQESRKIEKRKEAHRERSPRWLPSGACTEKREREKERKREREKERKRETS